MKGVSQVLTSAILLAVAVSVAGVYSNWAPGMAEQITGDAAEQTNQDIKCSNAALTIASAEYDLSGNFTQVELRNSGTINFNKGIQLVVFDKESGIMEQMVIDRLRADKTLQKRIYSDKVPERLAASSKDCPDIVVSTDVIDVVE